MEEMILNYNVDELFRFKKIDGGYSVQKYLKVDDPSVTEIEIPEEYNGEPVRIVGDFYQSKYIKRVVFPPSVRIIGASSFSECESLEIAELSEGLEEINFFAFEKTKLKSVVLPKSLKQLGYNAFACCYDLESVSFNSSPSFMDKVFACSFKLPADVTLMGLVNSCDLGEPFEASAFYDAFNSDIPVKPRQEQYLNYIRPDVFELAAQNNCFRSVDVSVMLKFLAEIGDVKSISLAEKHGMLDDAALLDTLTKTSAEQGKTEVTAYLLDLKNRKFGFDGFGEGGDFEL